MKLAQLELKGFKSFSNKTSVRFDQGITAIVGPNGCGKSNIVDALRWVLGEQRPSLLRSAAMSHVIFNGTAQKKALGMAEVTITISNNKGILPTEFTDITLSRRLYRSGESEYLLNNKICRLKDINDLFVDTGMGPNAYSVIELSMVEEILNDKNNDRRRLFEEAAGITKFKERKRQTHKKLSDTRDDLQRMEDILSEIRKKSRSLRAQASRAERALEYRRELEHLDQAVSLQEYNSIKEKLDPMLDHIANASSAKEEVLRNLDKYERNEKEAHEQLLKKEEAEDTIHRKVIESERKIQNHQTGLRIKEEKITNEESVISRYEVDIDRSEKEIKIIREKLERNKNTSAQATKDALTSKNNRDEAFTLMEAGKKAVSELKGELEKVNEKHQEAGGQVNIIQNNQIRLESRIESASEQAVRLKKEIDENHKKRDILSEESKAMAAKRDALFAEKKRVEKEYELHREKHDALMAQISEKKDVIRGFESRRDAFEAEYQLFKELFESSDGDPGGVRSLKKNRNDFQLFEVLSDVFTVSEKFSAAIEAVLGEASNYVITKNLEEAHRAFRQLKENEGGRVTIIPLDILTGDDDVLDGSLYHKTDCAPVYDFLKRFFFGRVMLAESIEEALIIARDQQVTAVTVSGDVVTKKGFVRSGSKSKNAGIRIGLQEKVKDRNKKAKELHYKIEKAQQELSELVAASRKYNLDDLRERINRAAEDIQKHDTLAGSCQTKIDFYKNSIEEIKARILELNREVAASNEELKKTEPERDFLSRQMEELVKKQVSTKALLKEKEEALMRLQNRHNDLSLKDQNAKNHLESLTREKERFELEISSIKERLKEEAERATKSKNMILLLRKEIEKGKEELKKEVEEKELTESKLEEARAECSRQRGKIHLIEEGLKEFRNKKDSNQELLYSLEVAKSRLEMDIKNLQDHIWENYHITIDQIDATLPEEADISVVKETIFTLKERLKNLGEVNPLAIEEYKEEKERVDHFEKQIDDLENAEKQLIETIQEINKTAKVRFNNTFNEIRKNFQTVFTTLFGEHDHCDLLIKEHPEDVLEAKIDIVANPFGKRPNVIEQLSGGEKTLTAIALLFAIYLVKPSPFCVMDEVDAPLDDPNILRFTKLLKNFSKKTQFIVITHNKMTMDKSDMIYGVTMPEPGISKLVGVRLDEANA